MIILYCMEEADFQTPLLKTDDNQSISQPATQKQASFPIVQTQTKRKDVIKSKKLIWLFLAVVVLCSIAVIVVLLRSLTAKEADIEPDNKRADVKIPDILENFSKDLIPKGYVLNSYHFSEESNKY